MCTPGGLQPPLERLATLTCTHRTHEAHVGGKRSPHGWPSASHSAYPPNLNMIIANATAARVASNPPTRDTTANGPPPRPLPDVPPTPRDIALAEREEPQLPAAHANADADNNGDDADDRLRQHFRRGLCAYQLRNRSQIALLTAVRNASSRNPDFAILGTGCALAVSAVSSH
eukprot:4730987-Pleurochrysis_carterae.AAC.2